MRNQTNKNSKHTENKKDLSWQANYKNYQRDFTMSTESAAPSVSEELAPNPSASS